MTHTPGPWEYRGHWIYPVGSSDDVGRVSEGYLRPSEERDANGYLIAAAPQLLEALRECVHALTLACPDGTGPGCYALHHARAAIKAAEGGMK